MKKRFPQIVKIALLSIYLIFLAGSVVRMTGSGMGCPDWPKCFGHFIPPISEEQIKWHPYSTYKKGMIIIANETLFVAKKDIVTLNKFNNANWEKYTKHNYATFNKYHTWTEYINRLTSALAGIVFVFLLASAFLFRKENKQILLLASLAFIFVLFEAWLGKIVVDTNLKPVIITIHMAFGLVVIAILLKLLHIVTPKKRVAIQHQLFSTLLIISIICSLIQIIMGTQVRQFIDEQVKQLGFENKNYSLLQPNFNFYFHRSFTIIIVLVNFGLLFLNQLKNLGFKLVNWIVLLIFIETITGILMYYAEFPIGTQAIHLLSGAILFGLQFYLWIEYKTKKIVT